jgi:Fe-S-cluster containining protein
MESNDWVTGEVVLSIGGEPLKMSMTVPATPVKPHRMLPVFQKMTNSFVEISAVAAGARGETISCRIGCGACCRQPVPIAEIEIYHLAEVVESMPEPRRTEIKERFRKAVEHLKSLDWFEKMKEIGNRTLTETKEEITRDMQKAAMEYFHEGIACPFLENESCSIHEYRPVACREYLVTSPAVNCSNPTAENIKMVELVLNPSKTLRYVGVTGRFTGFIPLVRALEFAEEHPEKFEEKTGERWAADFFSKLVHQPIPKEGIDRDPLERDKSHRNQQ